MKSKTKYSIEDSAIKAIFQKASLGEVSKVISLDKGEFNSAYFVCAGGNEYVLKIAPKEIKNVLTYENDLMAREVDFYSIIARETTVSIPKVFYYDDSKSIIPSEYFIMEKLKSKPLFGASLSKLEKIDTYQKVGEMVAKLHKIKGQKFGYVQNGLYDNWYLAIKSMVNNLIEDCSRKKKRAKEGKTLLSLIEKHKDILQKVECTYTHFDIWDGNIFYEKNENDINISLIDTERGFWGDCIGDFVSIETFAKFENKVSITAYNKTADNPITFNREEIIRYYTMKAYLALIMYSEKFVRYTKLQLKYFFNYIFAKSLFKESFKILKSI